MLKSCILVLETLEERLPPVGISALADVTSSTQTSVAKINASLHIRTNLVQALRSLAARPFRCAAII